MPETITSQPEVDFEAVASGVLDAIRPVVEREMKEAANQLYGATLEAVQDYLSDNASFNIRSRLDAAERDRRTQWERAEAAEKVNSDLLQCARTLASLHEPNRGRRFPTEEECQFAADAVVAASKSESPNV